MIKELFLAVILGTLLGFGITGGFLAVKNNKNSQNKIIANLSPTPVSDNNPTPTPDTPSITTTGTDQLTIESPLNEAIVTNSKINLKGSASPLSTLIITTPIKTYYITADNAGNFNTDIEIDSGVNLVQVDAIDPDDNQTTAKVLVTYSTAKF